MMATLAVPITSLEQWRDPNCVKVVCDARLPGALLQPQSDPFVRDAEPDFSTRRFLQHLGLYAYRRRFLLELAQLPPEPLELTEKTRAIARAGARPSHSGRRGAARASGRRYAGGLSAVCRDVSAKTRRMRFATIHDEVSVATAASG